MSLKLISIDQVLQSRSGGKPDFRSFMALTDSLAVAFLAPLARAAVDAELAARADKGMQLIPGRTPAPGDGNLGIGFFRLADGSGFQVAAFSQATDGQIAQAAAAFQGRTNEPPEAWRFCDSEFQILNIFHSARCAKQSDEFNVFIFSDRAPCRSCFKVIEDFLAYYGGATIVVEHRCRSNGPARKCERLRVIFSDWGSAR